MDRGVVAPYPIDRDPGMWDTNSREEDFKPTTGVQRTAKREKENIFRARKTQKIRSRECFSQGRSLGFGYTQKGQTINIENGKEKKRKDGNEDDEP